MGTHLSTSYGTSSFPGSFILNKYGRAFRQMCGASIAARKCLANRVLGIGMPFFNA